MYEFYVRSAVAIDGDTVDSVIDLGFGLTSRLRVRICHPSLYVDTPERSSPDWAKAKTFTQQWLDAYLRDGTEHRLACRTQKAGPSSTGIGDGAFGRWLGDFYPGGLIEYKDAVATGKTLATGLVEKGWVRSG